ncbi:VOC family protein [Paenibacillus sp. 1011MAR3C5]|uniref:VOC family protein n=1 Tax=Paenibacillus sp. 1011MAR3C5 TaxID=1675787 RepID=UPI000E6CA4C4|nr:VOC family protein [Paenibacillus sp. 1011MAR3C5]RJE90514.1 VOC family protein [Paenibacillus sp. 1011MAR3C5]
MSIKLTPYLVMEGNAKEAITFYQEVLGAEVLMQQAFGEMPANPEYPLPESVADKIAHAHLKIDESELMLFDSFPGSPYSRGNNITVCVTLPNAERATEVFEKLANGGHIVHPLQATFFSPAFGTVTDAFGITFTVTTDTAQ